ncbi:MAG: GPP34 family phosphoprotein [Bacteroidota bacterium]
MQLNLVEKLMLLATDDHSGKSASGASYLNYSMAGACILALSLHDRVNVDGKKLVVTSSEKVGNKVLDAVLAMIVEGSQSRTRTINHWINRLSSKYGQIKSSIISDLIDKRILEEKEGKILWFIPTVQYPAVNSKPENEVRYRLKDIVLNQAKPSPEEAMLLSLVSVSGLIREVFGKAQSQRSIKKRIDALAEDEEIHKAVSATVKQVQAAVTMMLTTATIAATASASS